ncbi:MAG TPA: nucleotidyltransferase family protein [Candidatus Binatia bacterium]|nr:nucleotidyltransferase family protein [Candidatus Binatia bacterium]
MKAPPKDAQPHFFYQVISILNRSSVPFLVGGGFAFEFYTRIGRSMKDMDLVVRRSDLEQVFEVLDAAGFKTELTFSHWLGKVSNADFVVDIIFNSGNGLCEVDDLWFQHATPGQIFGFPVKFCPPEEMIWMKAFIMERERYDGGDVAHLLLKCGNRLDWGRLVSRFGFHWRVLLGHLILFGYIYPSERQQIPHEVIRELVDQLARELGEPNSAGQSCQGPLLSRTQYRPDIEKMGFQDARLTNGSKMSPEEAIDWTDAGELEEPKR